MRVVVFRLLFKLSLRDLVRMFLMRGYEFTHEAVVGSHKIFGYSNQQLAI